MSAITDPRVNPAPIIPFPSTPGADPIDAAIYNDTTGKATTYPLYLDDLVLTGSDGSKKPLTAELFGEVTGCDISLTVTAASTVTVTVHDPTRALLRNPILTVGLPSVTQVAQAIASDSATSSVLAIGPGGSSPQFEPPTPGAANDVQANEQTVITVGANQKVPRAGLIIAIMTILTESGGVNLSGGDRDSVGLFQQRPSQGLGSVSQCMDPVHASISFYNALVRVPGWESMLPWVAAQSVQRSAWTGTPRQDNGYSSVVGGNYQAYFDQATSIVQQIRPDKAAVNGSLGTNDTGVSTGVIEQGQIGLISTPSAAITYRGVKYLLVRMETQDASLVLTFEDALINKLRQNISPYTEYTTIFGFINALLLQSGMNPHFVQPTEVTNRPDPTGALNAGQTDPGTLAEFKQLLATDGKRGAGTFSTRTKYADIEPDPTDPTGTATVTNGVVNDSWTVISSSSSTLRWLAFSNGDDIFVGSDIFCTHFIDLPTLVLVENTDGLGYFNGSFDLGDKTNGGLTFATTVKFDGLPGQPVLINNMGTLSGAYYVESVEYGAFSVETNVTLARIVADLEEVAGVVQASATAGDGGGGSNTDPEAAVSTTNPYGQAVITFAKRQLGKTYIFGATGPDHYDCSGLTQAAYAAAGVSIPRTSTAQFASVPRVTGGLASAQPGDLVFFGSPVHHVGIYVGNDQMIDSPDTGSYVKFDNANRPDLAGVGRPGAPTVGGQGSATSTAARNALYGGG